MAVSDQSIEASVEQPVRTFREGGWNPRLVITLVLLIVVSEVAYLSYVYPLSALTEIVVAFPTDQIAWVATLTALSGGVSAGLVGNLADRYGKRRVMLGVLTVALVGMLLGATAQSFEILLVARVLQGVGLAVPFLVPSLIRDTFPTKTLPVASAVGGTGSGALSVFAALLVGLVLVQFGWRGTFWVPAVFTAFAIVLTLVFIREGEVNRERRSIDFLGGLLLGAGVGGLLLYVSFGQTWGWTSLLALGTVALGIVLLVIWVLRSLKIKDPLVNIRVLATRPAVALIGMSLLGIGVQAWGFSLIPIVVLTPGAGLGLAPAELGLFSTIFAAGPLVGGFIAGPLLARFPVTRVALLGTAMLTAGFVVGYFGQGSIPLFLAFIVLIGVGGGFITATLWNLVVLIVAPEYQASTASVVTVSYAFGGAASSVIVFAAMNSVAQTTPGVYSAQALGLGFLVPAIIAAGSFVFALLLLGRRNLQSGTHS